jgi:hypothetical protein
MSQNSKTKLYIQPVSQKHILLNTELIKPEKNPVKCIRHTPLANQFKKHLAADTKLPETYNLQLKQNEVIHNSIRK